MEGIVSQENSTAVAVKKRETKPPSESKRNKAKRLRIAGQSYINSKGQCVPGREIGPDCNCRLKCYSKIDENRRQEIFKGFYALKSHDEQGSYLYGLIKKHNVKRKRAKVSDGKFSTYKYHVRNKGKEIQICKKAFANIHSISFKKIRNLCEKLDQDVMLPLDLRGKHENRPSKIPSEIMGHIKNFILSVLQSDQLVEFIREDKAQRQFDINISKLYKQYMKVHEPEAFDSNGKFCNNYTRLVKSWLFKKVFDEEIIVDHDKLKEIMRVTDCCEAACASQSTSSKGAKRTSAKSPVTSSQGSRPDTQTLTESEALPEQCLPSN